MVDLFIAATLVFIAILLAWGVDQLREILKIIKEVVGHDDDEPQ